MALRVNGYAVDKNFLDFYILIREISNTMFRRSFGA